jgi:hypothetical protein
MYRLNNYLLFSDPEFIQTYTTTTAFPLTLQGQCILVTYSFARLSENSR